jgi:WD40 repeat protein
MFTQQWVVALSSGLHERRGSGMAAAQGYDAFISYSHRHGLILGPALQTGLERFAKPWYRMRALRIFRDTASLSANPALWVSIEGALQSSAWFILLASPDAARSAWVNREVRWWRDNRPIDRLLVVGTSPGLAWDEQRNDWDADAPVPSALRGAFTAEPRWVDLSDLSLGHRTPRIPVDRLAEVAVPIRGVQKDLLAGERLNKHRRAMRLAWGAVAFLLALTVGLAAVAVVAVRARQQAIGERNIAISGRLISQSEAIGITDPTVARLESIAAWRLDPSSAAYYAMLTAAALPEIATIKVSPQDVAQVVYSSGGKVLASYDGSGTVRLWNTATRERIGRALRVAPGNSDSPYSDDLLTVSPDGKTLAIITEAGVKLWDVATRRPTGETIGTARTKIDSVAFSPDGRILASAGTDRTVHLWKMATGRPIRHPFDAGVGQVFSLGFSPDGKTLAAAGNNGTVRLWNMVSGQPIGTPIDGNTGPVHWVVFSPDGNTLVTASDDGTVRLWSMDSLMEFARLTGIGVRGGPAQSVAYTADGTMLAIGNKFGTALWDAATRRRIATSRSWRRGGCLGGVQPERPDPGHSHGIWPDPAVGCARPKADRTCPERRRPELIGGLQPGRQDLGRRNTRRQSPAVECDHAGQGGVFDCRWSQRFLFPAGGIQSRWQDPGRRDQLGDRAVGRGDW